MKVMGTQHMPRTMQALQTSQIATDANLDSFVFLRVHQDSQISVDDADGRYNHLFPFINKPLFEIKILICNFGSIRRHEEVSLEEKSQHIIRYRPVKDLVPSGALELV